MSVGFFFACLMRVRTVARSSGDADQSMPASSARERREVVCGCGDGLGPAWVPVPAALPAWVARKKMARKTGSEMKRAVRQNKLARLTVAPFSKQNPRMETKMATRIVK
jgi:hypothetical protein